MGIDSLLTFKVITTIIWLAVACIGFNHFLKLRRRSTIVATLFLLVIFLSFIPISYVITIQHYSVQTAMILSALGFAIAFFLLRTKTRRELDELFKIHRSAGEKREHLSSLAAHAFEGIYLVDPETMNYVDVNPAGARALNYSREEMIGMSLLTVHPNDMPLMREKIDKAITTGRRVSFTVNAYQRDQTITLVEVALTKVSSEGQTLVLAVGRDLTRRQKAQHSIEQLNRLYELLTQSNRAITRVKNKNKLYEKICGVASADGGFLLAWIGEVDGNGVVPVYRSGQNDGYVESLNIKLNVDAYSQGPVVRSIREKSVVCINDISIEQGFKPWRESAVSRGYNSAASVPLLLNDQVCAVLVLYSDQSNVFDERFKQLLSNLSEDLSYALKNLDAEQKRNTTQKRLRLLSSAIDQSADAVTIMNAEGIVEYVNPKFTLLTGYRLEEITGKSPSILCCNKVEIEKFNKVFVDLKKGLKWRGEFKNTKKSGENYWSMDTISPIRDDEGSIVQYVSTSVDYTALRQAQDKIEQLAFYDSLTGLPNRRLLHDRLKQAINISSKNYSYIAVLMLDIDKFKNINDSMGHKAGDELIKQVALLLTHHTSGGGTVARLGGDEFIIVLSNIKDMKEVVFFTENLLEKIRIPMELLGNPISITSSVGISMYPLDGGEGDELLRSADLAMYHAKSEGRNNFQFYTREMNERALTQLNLERRLKVAVQQQNFELYYQPQVDVETGVVKGVEALIRWVEEGEYIPPDKFIPVAEECGLMGQIGEWVLKQAFNDAEKLQSLLPSPVTMAINLSVCQFRESDKLIESVAQKLKDTGINAAQIELELTESMLIENVDTTVESLNALRALGVTLAIDDFGTGYSSLSYLKNFPVDTLKIDRSFIKDIGIDASDAAITVAIITLANELNMSVLAEGVETEGQLLFLEGHGCSTYQGYFYSKPLPFDALVELLGGEGGEGKEG